MVDNVTAAVVVIIVLGLYGVWTGKVSGETVLGVIIPEPCSLLRADLFLSVIALVPSRGNEFVE